MRPVLVTRFEGALNQNSPKAGTIDEKVAGKLTPILED
jgi:hypothetical protein